MRTDTSRYDELFNDIKVQPVDMDALAKEIEELFRKSDRIKSDENVKLTTFAIIEDVFGKKHLIDRECIEYGLAIHPMVQGPKYINTDPGLGVKMESFDEFKVLPSISLKEFMDDRYGYNSRVLNNMDAWMSILR